MSEFWNLNEWKSDFYVKVISRESFDRKYVVTLINSLSPSYVKKSFGMVLIWFINNLMNVYGMPVLAGSG